MPIRRRIAFALVLVAAAAGGAAWGLDRWRTSRDWEQIRLDLKRGHYAEARSALGRLAERRPGDGEVLYQLGVCQATLGDEEGAVRSWSAVADDSPFAGRAAVERARRVLRGHRLAEAEDLMAKALRDEGPHATEARETLVNLFKIQGRFREAERLVREAAETYPDRIGLLKELAVLGSINPFKLDRARAALETASAAAPGDDRVWLGRANLATRTGDFAGAAAWLDRCTGRRPDDPAVWRARLDLARAREDGPAAREALAHLPDGSLDPAEILGLRAWFAGLSGDEAAEREALRRLVALPPAHLEAIERLAELELRRGDAEEAARLRARKTALDRAKAQYEIILFGPDAPRRPAQLAEFAEALGRRLESRILRKFALARQPDDPSAKEDLARLDASPEPAPPGEASLAALLAAVPAKPAGGPSADEVGPRPAFGDDAESAGLRFTFDNGVSPNRQLPETMSGGLALLDFDGDGWLDVYCVQGGPFPPDPKAKGGDRLFRNKGDGTFEDATRSSGIADLSRGYGHGVTAGDVDNDGRPDLFLTRWRSYALYRNRGDGTFEDITERAGLGGDRGWPTSAALADLDADGDLDLYVCHYLKWDAEHPTVCDDARRKGPAYCGPPKFPPEPDRLFRNDGGRFVDVTEQAGIADRHGQGLGVVACDFDGDGRPDLFVANDQSANFLFRNRGGMRFEEVAESCGVASSATGMYQANMGIALGDPDGDGRPDLIVTEFYNEGTTLFQNLGDGVFADHKAASGLLVPTRYRLGFGVAFLDFNADGRLDLATANGHVEDFRPAEPWKMPAQLLAGAAGGRFVDVTPRAGAAWQVPRLGRGLTAGDLDNDGRVDVLILGQNEPLAYFHNRTAGGHRLTIRLEGTASNRDAVGARVTVVAAGRRQTAWRFGGGSYQSASDPRLHFGLGGAARADRVEVAWPSGRTDVFEGLEADSGYLIREGAGRPGPLAGFRR